MEKNKQVRACTVSFPFNPRVGAARSVWKRLLEEGESVSDLDL